MSKKNKNSDFNNKAARRFRSVDKVDLYDQSEVFDILEGDINIIMEQVIAYENHDGKWPNYIENVFANLSSSLWFYNFVKDHCKTKKGKLKTDLAKEQVEALKHIIADAYKKSVTNKYQQQVMELEERNDYLLRTFVMLDPKHYKLAKKFEGLSKKKKRELTIQVYGDPVKNVKFVHKLVDESMIKPKRKMKLFKQMYGKRYVAAVGALFTINSNMSDFIGDMYDHVMDMSKKKRAPYIYAFAKAFKVNKTANTRLNDGKFLENNKRMIKELYKDVDIGFYKAFKYLRKNNPAKKKEKE